MKIAIMGSTQYLERMIFLQYSLEEAGHEVVLPVLDNHGPEINELTIMETNRAKIEWADMIYFVWDQRSPGAFGDFCMAFALRKSIRLAYIEPKIISNFMRQYEAECLKKDGF